MELVDEQYRKVFRYVDGEMDAEEQKAFETSLAQNKALQNEVAFYKEVRLLSESVEQKICNTDPLPGEKKSNDEKAWAMLSSVREDWEKRHEDVLKLKYGIHEAPGIQTKQNGKAREIKTSKAALIDEKTILHSSRAGHGKLKRINRSTWLAAAVLTGLFLLGFSWWYLQNEKDSKLAGTTKADSFVVEKKREQTPEKIIPQAPSLPPNDNTSSKNLAKQDENKIAKQANDKIKAAKKKNYRLDKTKQEAMFAGIFKPDTVPSVTDRRLRQAIAFYNTGDYENALLAFTKSETLVKRGFDENEASTRFYNLYYKAQTYLAMDSAIRAVIHLKTAIAQSPGNFWKSKAQWYLALAYLKTGNLKETERLLEQLGKNNQAGEYKQKSIDLMKELRQN